MRTAEREQAFNDWAHARSAALVRSAYLLCGDWHAAEDHVQETLVKVYMAWPKVNDSVDGYARRTLVNVFLARKRLKSSGEYATDMSENPSAWGQTSDPSGGVINHLTLAAALAEVPKSQRAVLVLRYWEDMSVVQVAAVLKCSVGNVKSQAARGLSTLRTALQRQGIISTTLSDQLFNEGRS
ncbi:MAG: SigE family RNA polymerase sigma factor [Actinomycetota bacterium]